MPPWTSPFSFLHETRGPVHFLLYKTAGKGLKQSVVPRKKGPDLVPTQAARTSLPSGKQQGESDGGRQRNLRPNIQGDALKPL